MNGLILATKSCFASLGRGPPARLGEVFVKYFRLAAIAGALALSAFTYGATAQTAATQPAAASAPGRAPLSLFYGYDTFRSPDISPNGRYIAAIHREAEGDVIVVIDLQTHHISQFNRARADQLMELNFVQFKSDDRIVFGFSQKLHVVPGRGLVNRTHIADDAFTWVSRVYSSNIDGTDLKALYDPSADQGFPRWLSGDVVSLLLSDPDHILLIAPAYNSAELWRVNVRTGEHTVVERGTSTTFNWIVDNQGTPVLRVDSVASGRGYAWSRRGPGQSSWVEIVRFIGADGANTAPVFRGLGPALQPGQVFVLSRREGDDTSGLYIFDTSNGNYVQTVETNPNYDITEGIRDVHANTVLAACWWEIRWTCLPKDPAFAQRWNAINRALGDQVNVNYIGRGAPDNSRWLISTNGPQDLGTYYLYDTNARTMTPLFNARANVDPALLPTERVVRYTTSDGQQQWGYLWIPPGVRDARNLPTIVVPHGGPEGRDVWGFDPFANTYASQGYAVFQPNFRGGGGFGRRFVEAGWRQWGARMQQDVTDGVHYLIQQGIVDPARICIAGWSHGGYMTMTATFENADLYKCAVAGAGISDMTAMLRWVRDGETRADVMPSGGQGGQSISYRYWSDAMGDISRDHDYLVTHSAADNASRVTVPLLLIHGDEDFTVPIEQSQIMQRAMQRAGHPVRLITLVNTEHHYTPDQGDAWRTVFTESLGFFQQNIGPGVPPGSQ
jgi:dipeptidyl aminopeptidase/acylaminoacyl peptidase